MGEIWRNDDEPVDICDIAYISPYFQTNKRGSKGMIHGIHEASRHGNRTRGCADVGPASSGIEPGNSTVCELENHLFFGKSSINRPCSMAMLYYQMVFQVD